MISKGKCCFLLNVNFKTNLPNKAKQFTIEYRCVIDSPAGLVSASAVIYFWIFYGIYEDGSRLIKFVEFTTKLVNLHLISLQQQILIKYTVIM